MTDIFVERSGFYQWKYAKLWVGNGSFESCQLDFETEAVKTSNENLLSWQACLRTDTHTCRYGLTRTHTGARSIAHTDYSQSPWECLDKWHFHMLKVTNEIGLVSIYLDTARLWWRGGSHRYETLVTSGWKTSLYNCWGIYGCSH